MKSIVKLTTAFATLTLALTACGTGDPDTSETTQATETPQTQDKATQEQRYTSEFPDYQRALASEHILLTDEELDIVGKRACLNILNTQEDEYADPVALDSTSREDISRGIDSAYMTLIELEASIKHRQAITYAAIHHICPEVLDQLEDKAENHHIFREDRRAELHNN